MNDLRRKLFSGKSFAVLALVLWFLFTIAVATLGVSAKAVLLFSIGIGGLCLLTTLMMKEVKSVHGLQRQLEREIKSVAALKSQAIQNDSAVALLPKESADRCSCENDEQIHMMNYFAPARISSTTITAKPSAHTAGRLAAEQSSSESPTLRFSALLDSSVELAPRVAYIGDKNPSLEEFANVTYLRAGQALNPLDPEVSWVIIDEPNCENTPWSGLTNAASTAQFLALSEFLRRAKQIGQAVLFVQADTPSHLTQSLCELADLSFKASDLQAPGASDVGFRLINALKESH